jgi:hypothetical protein
VQHGLCVEVDKYDLQKLNQTLVPKFNCTSKLCIAVHDAVRGKLSGSPLDPTTYQPANITGSKPFDPLICNVVATPKYQSHRKGRGLHTRSCFESIAATGI